MENTDSENQFYDTVQKIVARAWVEPDFKNRLLTSPREAVTEMGLTVPADVTINVIEDTETKWNFVIPVATDAGTVESVEVIASAGSSSCGKCACIGKCYIA